MKKIGAKRIYNHAWPNWEFEEYLSWRSDKNAGHGTNKSKIHRIFSKKVRRFLECDFNNELRMEL